MSKIISAIFLLLLFSGSVKAQDNDYAEDIYNMAIKDYEMGFIDEAEQQLLDNMRYFKGNRKTFAYRYLALCELEKGNVNKAKNYVDLLLKNNPYYTQSIADPQRLIDLINQAKEQEADITTASRQAESIEEAPVPVTVITRDMIRQSGALTLRELLCLFVPGMSQAEGMESNISMHGISGLTQESILFLQDGHRLNGGSSNAEAPDYRNSLDKIQQIEVLRGPASSLYGNVALTAVVNIITYKGAKLNGGRISATVGTQNTYGGSFVVGGGNNVVDITGWGSINSTSGFKHIIDNTVIPGNTTTLYAHGFNNRPSYDIGIKARWGDFIMTINSQRSKQVPYYNIVQFPADRTAESTMNTDYKVELNKFSPEYADYNSTQNYNYDKYNQINSNKPGTTRTNHHINLDFNHSFGNVDFQASGYVSLEHTDFYNVLGDSIDTGLLKYMINTLGLINISNFTSDPQQKSFVNLIVGNMFSAINKGGVFFDLNWENITFGGQAQILTKYDFLGHGSAIFGLQYEHFALTEGTFNLGFNYSSNLMITKGEIFDDGMEDIISAYTQIKHYFSKQFILNAGLRYDHKKQQDNNRLNYFSPRLSLIYKITPVLSARASYNYSFVDAPYLYRAMKLDLFGGDNLQPEKMKSVQAGLTYHKSHLTAEVSAYYNAVADIITQRSSSTGLFRFQSSGKMKQACVEAAMQYANNRLILNTNATWQRILKSDAGCNIVNGNRLGVPSLMGNFFVSWCPYTGKGTGFINGGRLWINATVNAQTRTYYQQVDFLLPYMVRAKAAQDAESASGSGNAQSQVTPSQINYREINSVDPQVVLGLGATYEWRHLDINLSFKNITNNQYLVGSNMSEGVPHAGRQLVGKVTVKF